MIKVSVIVPIYNVQKYLEECLDSILRQTLRDIEVICVNDGSTDNSLEILERYAKLDPRIMIINKTNSGYGASMNQGIMRASGEYIGIVEPDDYVEPEMYEELYEEASKFRLDWIKGNFQIFTGLEERRRSFRVGVFPKRKQKLYGRVLNPQEYPELIEIDDFHWKGIYRREFLDKENIVFNETPGAAYQDNGFKYQTICMAKQVMYLEKAYYWYRRDNLSASTYNPKGLEMMYKEYQFIKDFMNRNFEQTKVFLPSYYKKLYMQFQDQLEKVFDREWEDIRLREIVNLYCKELLQGVEAGYLKYQQMEEWVECGIKLLLRYPQSFFEQRKIQDEVRREKYCTWLRNIEDKKIVIVCGGEKGRQIINFIDNNGITGIEAVCDNDKNKWGRKLYQYPIVSPEQAVRMVPGGYFLITKAGDTLEIRKQLEQLGISEDCIEELSIPMNGFLSISRIL